MLLRPLLISAAPWPEATLDNPFSGPWAETLVKLTSVRAANLGDLFSPLALTPFQNTSIGPLRERALDLLRGHRLDSPRIVLLGPRAVESFGLTGMRLHKWMGDTIKVAASPELDALYFRHPVLFAEARSFWLELTSQTLSKIA